MGRRKAAGFNSRQPKERDGKNPGKSGSGREPTAEQINNRSTQVRDRLTATAHLFLSCCCKMHRCAAPAAPPTAHLSRDGRLHPSHKPQIKGRRTLRAARIFCSPPRIMMLIAEPPFTAAHRALLRATGGFIPRANCKPKGGAP